MPPSERYLRPLARSRADRRQKLRGVRAPDSLPHHSAVSRAGGRTELQGPRHLLPVDHVDDTMSLVVHHFMKKQEHLVNSLQEDIDGKHIPVSAEERTGGS